MNSNKPIILVGGGTGGHIYPLIAIAEELELRSIPFCFVGGTNSYEQKLTSEHNWQFIPIATGKWRRYLTVGAIVENIIGIFKTSIGFFQSIKIIFSTGANTIFSKGGHVSLPMVIAAKFLGRRVIIHESDVVMGLANRIAARFADTVLVAFDPKIYPGSDSRYVQVGIPIRASLRRAASLATPKKSRPLTLILAGIQGSLAINKIIRESLTELIKFTDIVHVTGESDYLVHKNLAKKLPTAIRPSYKPFSFLGRELAYYYKTTDLVVTRASATVIAEVALFGKPLYLIPLPTAAGNHQMENAKKLNQAGAVIYREQSEVTPQNFVSDLESILTDKNLGQNLAKSLHDYFRELEAVGKIISIISPK